jgi:organic hydroperoxide reductase OsmC/OhrA
MRSVATAMGLHMRAARLHADGYFDVRGTLGVDRQAPIGVREIVVTAAVDCDGDDPALEKLARSTERYCVVAQSLRDPVRFQVKRASDLSIDVVVR